jgi:recombination protein RecT
VANEVQQYSPNSIASVQQDLAKRAVNFQHVLPAHISVEKFQRTVITAIQADPDLLFADRRSLLLACMRLAQDGVLPDKREAALVIFKERRLDKTTNNWHEYKIVQPMVMVYGLRKKILQSGEVKDIKCNVVYRKEDAEGYFEYEEGTDAVLKHRPLFDLTLEETEDSEIICAYSIATYADGSKSYEVMRRFEIDRIRQRSQTGAVGRVYQYGPNKDKPIPPKGPWVTDFAEMAKKTVMRRHSKTLPMSGDILTDSETDELTSARSAAAALGMALPDDPLLLETHDEDEEGGAVIPSNDQLAAGAQTDAPAADKKRRGRPPKQAPEESFDPQTGEIIDAGGQKQGAQEQSNTPAATDSQKAPDAPSGPENGSEAVDVSPLERAKAEIDGCDTNIPNINSAFNRIEPGLVDEDAAELREYVRLRILEIKASTSNG